MQIITNKFNENALNITLEGRLDTSTAPELEQTCATSLEGVETLILDFEKLDYISSAGLRVLLNLQKTMNSKSGEMIIKNANESIKEVFDITGFADILNLE